LAPQKQVHSIKLPSTIGCTALAQLTWFGVMDKRDIADMLTQPLAAHWSDQATASKQGSQSWPNSPFGPSDTGSPDTWLSNFISPGGDFADWKREVSFEEREIEALGGSSLLTSVLLMVQSMIGGGILAFPHAFLAGGLLNMFVMQLLMMGFITAGLWVLAWCSERTGAGSFQSLMREMIGRRAELASSVALVVLIFGASVVYLDIFVDQVHPWFAPIDRSLLTIIVAAFYPLLVLGRTMSSLALPSLLGCMALLYVCGMIIFNFAWAWRDGSLRFQSGDPVDQPVLWQSGLRQWLGIFPVVCFSYQGHISAVPLYYELTKKSMTRWAAVISLGLGICVVLYNATGCVAYLTFLDNTQGDILKSFLMEDVAIPRTIVTVARVAVAIKVCVTSGVFTFCARSAILDEMDRMHGKPVSSSYSTFLLVTFGWAATVALVAVVAPDISKVVSVIGNVSAFFMFHFPGMCILATIRADRHTLSNRSKRFRWVAGWTVIVLGTVVFFAGLWSAVEGL